jgi:hypothetical protein
MTQNATRQKRQARAAKASTSAVAGFAMILIGACSTSEDLIMSSARSEDVDELERQDPEGTHQHPTDDTRESAAENDVRCAVRRLENHVSEAAESSESDTADPRAKLLKQSSDVVAAQALMLSLLLLPGSSADDPNIDCDESNARGPSPARGDHG